MKYTIVATLCAGLLLNTSAMAHSDKPTSGLRQIEVAFVLDTTGSMGNLIAGAKSKIWSIANSIVDVDSDLEIRMSLIGYRDFGDQYVVKTFPLTTDIQELYGNLMDLRAAGGGDTPEAVNEALVASLEKVGWTQGNKTKRMVFLVGDAPPHMDYNGPQYPTLMKSAHDRGIIVNAIQAGDSRMTRRIWKEIAQLGGGEYIPIPQNGGKVVLFETPYDDEIIILQRQLDKTILPYGDRKRRGGIVSKINRRSESSKPSAIENSKFYSKRAKGSEIITGAGDLVADYDRSKDVLGKLKKTELPKVLQNKSTTERKTYLKELKEKRSLLQRKMSALISKRDKHIVKERAIRTATSGDSFDRAVDRTIYKAITSKF